MSFQSVLYPKGLMFKKKSYFSTLQENNTEIVFTYISERPE